MRVTVRQQPQIKLSALRPHIVLPTLCLLSFDVYE
jgi:hypothetical protein